jgi:hypothetical protein
LWPPAAPCLSWLLLQLWGEVFSEQSSFTLVLRFYDHRN